MITVMAFVSIVMASTLHSQRGCRVVAFDDPGFGLKCAPPINVLLIQEVLSLWNRDDFALLSELHLQTK